MVLTKVSVNGFSMVQSNELMIHHEVMVILGDFRLLCAIDQSLINTIGVN